MNAGRLRLGIQVQYRSQQAEGLCGTCLVCQRIRDLLLLRSRHKHKQGPGGMDGTKQEAPGLDQDEPVGEVAAYFSAASPEVLASKAASFESGFVKGYLGSGSSGQAYACRYGFFATPKMFAPGNHRIPQLQVIYTR